MIRIMVIAFSLLILAACAVAPVKESGLTQIKPAGIHEECVSAKSGQKINYSFYTSAPVDFNVHYHVGEKISYPLERSNVTTEDGTYVPDHEDIYCLMWTNNQKAMVTLNYKYEIQPRVRTVTPTPATRSGSGY
jgi:hypothetical protein